MFYIIGIAITFFLAFILLGKRKKTLADKILCLWLAVIGMHLVLVFLTMEQLIYRFPYLLGVPIFFPLIHGPLLFLYVSSLTQQTQKWAFNSLHFLPAVLMLFCFARFFALSGNSKIEVYQHKGQGYRHLLEWYSYLVKLSGIFYVCASLWILRKHKEAIADQFSNTDKINLNWLRYLILGVAVVWVFVLFGTSSHLYFAVVIFVIFIGYWGINQVGIFTPEMSPSFQEIDTIKIEPLADATPKSKYEKSGLTPEQGQSIHAFLQQKMLEEQLYTNSELTLIDLAKALSVHPNLLSQVINTYEGKNFYDYVNALRVEHFLRLVKNPENRKYTILSLCYECGFNSKSSFNKHFKRLTSSTPSEYINTL